MIPTQTVEEIRNKIDIIGVVSEYVKLRKAGKNYLGLCPFHSEKTPSFTVSPDKQLFHCFGCNEGGNVFGFLMKIENLSFTEAVEELGKKVGIAVEAASSPSKGLKEKLYDITALAAKFYRQALNSELGKPARAYLESRRVKNETAAFFGLGFAPPGWDNLFNYLISRGASPELIEKAGLILPREGKSGYYDRFRSRLMFPIFDLRGRAIAFSGRALGEEEPKYMNSPETLIFHKGEALYGINFGKDDIKKRRTAILVEGNLDLVSSFQAGFANAVAPLGTALTSVQCKILSRLCDTIVLAYDADSAGLAASERAVEIIRGEGLRVKVADLASFKDPDEIISKEGAGAFEKIISSALPWLEFRIKRALSRFNLQEAEAKAGALREAAALLSREKDELVQKEYIKRAAQWLKVEPEILAVEVKRSSFYQGGLKSSLRRTVEKPGLKIIAAEKCLISLACQNPEVFQKVKSELGAENFVSPQARLVAEKIFTSGAQMGEGADLAHFLLADLPTEEARNWLSGVLMMPLPEEKKINEVASDCLQVVKGENQKGRVAALRQKLKEAEGAGDHRAAAELVRSLKNEII